MGNLGFFENMIENKLKNLHTAYLATVISATKKTAKIKPLCMTKAYGQNELSQSVLSNVPIADNVFHPIEKTYTVVVEPYPYAQKMEIKVIEKKPIQAGDIVVCVCCERDITEARKGRDTVPPVGHHSMSDSVIVGCL